MRILIADDHDLLRDTLVMFLQGDGEIEVMTAASFAAAEECIVREPTFDLVILDYNMPGMNGLAGLTRAMSLPSGPDALPAGGTKYGSRPPSPHPQRVALISGEASRAIAEQALSLGAAGFLPKTLSAKSFVSAVKFMGLGEIYIPVDLLSAPKSGTHGAGSKSLTPREKQMLQGLTEGKSNKEIARDLTLQEATVKLHMKTLFRKIGAINRTQAAMRARDSGF